MCVRRPAGRAAHARTHAHTRVRAARTRTHAHTHTHAAPSAGPRVQLATASVQRAPCSASSLACARRTDATCGPAHAALARTPLLHSEARSNYHTSWCGPLGAVRPRPRGALLRTPRGSAAFVSERVWDSARNRVSHKSLGLRSDDDFDSAQNRVSHWVTACSLRQRSHTPTRHSLSRTPRGRRLGPPPAGR